MSLGTATVIRGNARCLPLPDNSVDLCVTSPPYFALRSYQDNGEHYVGQIGDEPTPTEFIDALIEVTAECVRVLKPTGSLWVNLGDKYAGQGAGTGDVEFAGQGARNGNRRSRPGSVEGIRGKSLIGIPWRYALRCIDDLGLILRAEVIWSKPNGLPESVTDRVRRSHEQWFHFTLGPRYFSAVDEIREGYEWDYSKGYKMRGNTGARENRDSTILADPRRTMAGHRDVERGANPLGKLPGSVWTVPTEPLQVPASLGVDHFAAFPTEFPRRIILGWSPVGVCTGCGQGRRPVTSVERTPWEGDPMAMRLMTAGAIDGGPRKWKDATRDIIGYACDCPEPTAPTTPSVIVDPFGGTGTTALVAKALGRHGISIDMSLDYARLARWRTNNLDQLAKVQGIRRSDAARAADGLDMDTLFDFDGGAA